MSQFISISIIIPTHNRPELLLRAVASALASCPEDGEVVVCDDRSVVPATETLSTYQSDRLRVVESSHSAGISGTRNAGAEVARGNCLLFLDDDDELMVDYPARVLEAFAEGAQFGFASRIKVSNGISSVERPYAPRGILPASLSFRRRIAAGCGFWISQSLFERVGGFDEQQVVDEDTEISARLASMAITPHYDPKPSVLFYRGQEAAGKTAMPITTRLRGTTAQYYRRTFELNEARFPGVNSTRTFLASRYMRRAIFDGETADAFRFAVNLRPLPYVPYALLYCARKCIERTVRRGPSFHGASNRR